jgi:hypothetical protein
VTTLPMQLPQQGLRRLSFVATALKPIEPRLLGNATLALDKCRRHC